MSISLRWFAPIVLALAASCGVSDFTGAYTGSITTTGSCADTSSWPIIESTAATWTVVQASNVVTIAPSGSCGDFSADATGTTAKLRAKICPKFTEGASTIQVTYTGGTLTLNGNALTAKLLFEATATGGSYQSCSGNTTATFLRNQKQ